MPRPRRYEIENGWYHVINRGAARRHIFLNDELKSVFLDVLGIVVERYGFKLYAFCLMGNHYHLLINTPFPNLSHGMRTLNAMYAQKFNGIRKKDGPVFKGRYKSIFIRDERYLNNLVRYIHLNPVSAGVVGVDEAYRWSSHVDYSQGVERYSWLNLLSWESLDDYRRYIGEGNNEKILDFFRKNRREPILG